LPEQVNYLLRLIPFALGHTLSLSSSLLDTGTNQAGHSSLVMSLAQEI